MYNKEVFNKEVFIMKVKASNNFNTYRCKSLELDIKDFRALQSGQVVDVEKELIDKNPAAFIETKEKEEVKYGRAVK
jgi:hypothetical protein